VRGGGDCLEFWWELINKHLQESSKH